MSGMMSKLERLKSKQEQLNNQIKNEEAKERQRLRKMETRRKILLGSLVESMLEKDERLRADIEQRLESFLTRAVDREAFGMMPLAELKQDKEAKESAA